MSDHLGSKAPREPAPDEAQIRFNPETGRAYIYVERPKVVSLANASPEELSYILEAIEASAPSDDELLKDRWSDEA